MILQEQITLEQLVLKYVVGCVYHGCEFNIIRRIDDQNIKYFLTFGCTGFFCNGEKSLLYKFINNGVSEKRNLTEIPPREITNLVSSQCIVELYKRKQCSKCGGFINEFPPPNYIRED